MVPPRIEPLVFEKLARKYVAPEIDGVEEFNKDRSVFLNFVEDSPELFAQML